MSGRLSFQHNFSRLVEDDYFVLYDAGDLVGPNLNECFLAESRGVESLSKVGTGHYRIVLKKKYRYTNIYNVSGGIAAIRPSALVFCNSEHSGVLNGTQVCRTQWYITEGTPILGYLDTLDVFTAWQTLIFIDPNYLVQLEAADAGAPVYVTIHQPLNSDVPAHLTGEPIL